MSKYLKISNQVEIEPNAFHLIGACTKRDDSSKIGYFGSGLKYAIAVLLREGVSFGVYSGKKKIAIEDHPDKLRGQEFNVIHIDGQKTSMTTSMGPKWKPWQAIREIYCNALDEPDAKLEQVDDVSPNEGETAFYFCIHGENIITDILANWEKYFSHNRPTVVKSEKGSVFHARDGKVSFYRKHIRCSDSAYQSLYDYDFDEIDINESRLASDTDCKLSLTVLWKRSANELMLTQLVSLYNEKSLSEREMNNDLIERKMYWEWHCGSFSELWGEYFSGKLLVPYESAGWWEEALAEPDAIKLPLNLIKKLKKQFGDKIKTCFVDFQSSGRFAVVQPTERQLFLIKECRQFFKEVKIELKYPIVVAKFDKPTIYGEAYNKEIVISITAFDQGKKLLAAVIMEEHMHLDTEYGDKTQEFQTYIINQMVTMLENQHGVFL